MLCGAPIKLNTRPLKPNERDMNKYKSRLLDEKLYDRSDYYHSYSFRWDRSKKFIGTQTNTNHCLAVNNILLPENAPSFNTGASLERWSKKTPRLKSSKDKKIQNVYDLTPKVSPVQDTLFNLDTLIQQFSCEIEQEGKEQTEVIAQEEEEEIDPDIQRLISISQSFSTDQDDEEGNKKKRKHKKKDKNTKDGKIKKEKNKMIRFSLSKPPSPQTVQVIRVDVTSNYSIEENNNQEMKEDLKDIVDCSRGCGKKILTRPVLKKQYSLHIDDGEEVDFLCKKLTLMERPEDDEN